MKRCHECKFYHEAQGAAWCAKSAPPPGVEADDDKGKRPGWRDRLTCFWPLVNGQRPACGDFVQAPPPPP